MNLSHDIGIVSLINLNNRIVIFVFLCTQFPENPRDADDEVANARIDDLFENVISPLL